MQELSPIDFPAIANPQNQNRQHVVLKIAKDAKIAQLTAPGRRTATSSIVSIGSPLRVQQFLADTTADQPIEGGNLFSG